SELAAAWMPNTPEVDVKIAFARQAGDEAGHFELVADRLAALDFDLAGFRPPGANPLFDYLRSLSTTVERVAAGLFTLESIAYAVNENFMAFCDRRGDAGTVRIYREFIQPDEQRHQQLGRRLLVKYATDSISQERARTVVGRVLEIATATRAQAAERIGSACFPGC
ncbi:MAG: ferritin-like domain-containing protein, partial [Solimonas sp.]